MGSGASLTRRGKRCFLLRTESTKKGRRRIGKRALRALALGEFWLARAYRVKASEGAERSFASTQCCRVCCQLYERGQACACLCADPVFPGPPGGFGRCVSCDPCPCCTASSVPTVKKVRRKRGLRRGKLRSRGGKPPRLAPPRPPIPRPSRATRAADWLEKRTDRLVENIERIFKITDPRRHAAARKQEYALYESLRKHVSRVFHCRALVWPELLYYRKRELFWANLDLTVRFRTVDLFEQQFGTNVRLHTRMFVPPPACLTTQPRKPRRYNSGFRPYKKR